ncbi:MAG: leucine-rich repeat domain-containing protein, partial [Oscillospiraceae bacterium]|nr:leucine-rich repeat domain-containing protein [Oscillospiraceae bacterium]
MKRMKSILAFTTALCMCAGYLPTVAQVVPEAIFISAIAEDVEDTEEFATSGTCGENSTWERDEETGILTISGTGAMTGWGSQDSPWIYDCEVIIEDGITTIGKDVFYASPKSITIRNPNCEIYDSEDTVPDTTTIYGYSNSTAQTYAEKYNKKFKEIVTSGTCGENLTWEFDQETGTLTINGTGEMTDYNDYDNRSTWWGWRTSIEKVVIGEGITTIGDFAFEYCFNLTSVTIPDSMTIIGDHTFSLCKSLTSITIPAGVTTISAWAFLNCYALTSIYVSEDNPNYSSQDGVLFNKDKTTLVTFPQNNSTNYIIPDSVTIIGDFAFFACSALESITIPDSVTTIGVCAFTSTSLTSVTIPDSVTTIGGSAFSTTGLISITIPDSVTTIVGNTFNGCSSLKSVTIPD